MSTISVSDDTMDIMTNLFTLDEINLTLFHERKEHMVVILELLEEEVEPFYKAIDLALEYRKSPQGKKEAIEAAAIRFMQHFPSIMGEEETDEERAAREAKIDVKIQDLITREKTEGTKILHERLMNLN
jgi:hypothetical protein